MPEAPAAGAVQPRDPLQWGNRIPDPVTNPLPSSRPNNQKLSTVSLEQTVMKKAISVFTFVMCCSHLAFGAQDYLEKIPSGAKAADYVPGAPVKTDYQIALDGGTKRELVRVLYGPGVSDKSLTIGIFKGKKKVDTLRNHFGIQPNYRIADIDGDGKKEIAIWEGLWDSRMAGEEGVTEKTFEGHSAPHRYLVMTYKRIQGKYCLWEAYTTRKKHDPFCEKQPEID
jgi:hypothetical protein